MTVAGARSPSASAASRWGWRRERARLDPRARAALVVVDVQEGFRTAVPGLRARRRADRDPDPGAPRRSGSRWWSPSSTRRAGGDRARGRRGAPRRGRAAREARLLRRRGRRLRPRRPRSGSGLRGRDPRLRQPDRRSTCSTRGVEVHVAEDAVGSRIDENKRVGLHKMEQAGAVLTSVETALFELLGRAGTRRVQGGPEADPRVRPEPRGRGEEDASVSERPATSCWRTARGSTASSAAIPGQITGEVVFNTSMTGYQEAVTDPSYAGQIITFTYPLIGNYGVSAEAMESDRVHARGVIMREGKNGEDAASAEGGWLDWLRDCGIPAIGGVDTRALVRHIRDRGAMRGGIFPAELTEAEARELVEAEPSMDGADFAKEVTPGEPIEFEGDGPARGRHRHRDQAHHHQAAPRAGLPDDAAALRQLGRGGPRARPRPGLPRQRPRRPGRPRLRRRERPRGGRQEAGGRHLPRPPAALPRRRPRDLQAPLRPPRRQPSGQGPRDRPDRHHLAEPRLRGQRARAARARSRATSRSAGGPTSARPSSPT